MSREVAILCRVVSVWSGIQGLLFSCITKQPKSW